MTLSWSRCSVLNFKSTLSSSSSSSLWRALVANCIGASEQTATARECYFRMCMLPHNPHCFVLRWHMLAFWRTRLHRENVVHVSDGTTHQHLDSGPQSVRQPQYGNLRFDEIGISKTCSCWSLQNGSPYTKQFFEISHACDSHHVCASHTRARVPAHIFDANRTSMLTSSSSPSSCDGKFVRDALPSPSRTCQQKLSAERMHWCWTAAIKLSTPSPCFISSVDCPHSRNACIEL